jgi:hypothetical protein
VVAAWAMDGGAQEITNDHLLFKDLVKNDPSTIILEKSKSKGLKSAKAVMTVVDSTYTYNWNADLQEWDTIVFIKGYYTYNERGKETGYTEIVFDGEKWSNSSRTFSNYDENGNLIEFVSQNWNTNEDEGNWQDSYRYIYKYNNTNQNTGISFQEWNEEQQTLVDSWNSILEYNNEGLNSRYIRQIWDKTNQTWNNYWQYYNEYHNSGLIQNYLEQTWNTNELEWVNKLRKTYNYNEINLLTSSATEINSYNNSWINFNLDTNIYNNFYQNVEYYRKNWDTLTNAWVDNLKKENVYDNDNLKETIIKYWKIDDWENNLRYEYSYSSNILISELNSEWDKQAELWIPRTLKNFETNVEGNIISSSYLGWSIGLDDWSYGQKCYFFYSLKPATLIDKENYSISLFPNPTHNTINFFSSNNLNILKIELSELSGKKIFSFYIKGGLESIDVSSLKCGVYILSFYDKRGEINNVKFIKK